MCSKPVVGSLRLLGVVEARLDNPTVFINHGFNHLDRHVSVDSFGREVGTLGVLHKLLDPLSGITDFHGNPRPHAIPRRAVVRRTRLHGEFQPVCTRNGSNLAPALGEQMLWPAWLQVRGVEQVGV